MTVKLEFKNFDKDLATVRSFSKVMGDRLELTLFDAAAIVAQAARNDIPDVALSGWNNWPAHQPWGFIGSRVRGEIISGRHQKKLRGRKLKFSIAVMSQDAAGVIYQTVGFGSSRSAFVRNINDPRPLPRGIWKAVRGEPGQRAKETMEAAVKEAENAINAKLGG